MWLVISRKDEISSYWGDTSLNANVEVFEELKQEQLAKNNYNRISQIFPLIESEKEIPDLLEYRYIRFCFFINPMRVLSQLKVFYKSLDVKVFFGYGISSIILFGRTTAILDELLSKIDDECVSFEEWELSPGKVRCENIKAPKSIGDIKIVFEDYDQLPISIKNIFEELHLSLSLFATKVASVPIDGLFEIKKINKEINSLIKKIKKYQDSIDIQFEDLKNIQIVEDLSEEELIRLKKSINKSIEDNYHKNQYVDRAIQLISIISYVSTQTFSGTIPVLSRRSLIRRHSLCGIGSGILALYRITDFIESIFHEYNFEEKITVDFKKTGSFLVDIESPHKYDTKRWKYSNIDEFVRSKKENNLFKLPYFSARLGFRESEYAISAAIQSITNGADPEWSIMTLTHELMHSQVRQLLNLILAGDLSEQSEEDKMNFYMTFRDISKNGFSEEKSLLDSVRYIVLTHCCLADKYGSLSVEKHVLVAGNELQPYDIPKDYNAMFKLLTHNFRNINEIFVHLFDLNYIYRGQIDFYIKSIWHSWSSLPHIDADLRQYILRCLIVISTKVVAIRPYERFKESVSMLKSSLVDLHSKIKKPLIARIILLLNDLEYLTKAYYGGFYSYLMLVDMIDDVFISEVLSSKIYNDDFVTVLDEAESEEMDFKYDLPDSFEDERINSPVAFLLDRIRKTLEKNEIDYSRETCKIMLSIIQ
ncbi:hypothetical protein [Flagellimonas lutaonensis]|uniref:Uncharacterized protein n=1 Tax=Flagellimonas lutaonensis TaxID=516051 RepID=A0A0D5YNL8_9FLAO|nr:hypothetical protein [Allomuricauda lutaonensis]AKA33915.1 hypothetical protein VC82_228 [Allomuricauda lutaonensis]